MELILVRHAEPADLAPGDPSSADPPLSPRGTAQARAVADWLAPLAVDAIVSSPAARAHQTATPLAQRSGAPLHVDPRLRDALPAGGGYVPIERDRGRDPAAYRARLREYREGDRLAKMAPRIEAALDEWTARLRGGRLVVFCHGSVVNVFAARVLGLPPAAFLEAGYASGHRFLISSSGIRSVRSLNETAYLDGLAGLDALP